MRAWTKSACAVLAWGLLLTVIAVAAALSGPAHPARAATRIAAGNTTVAGVARPPSPAADPAVMPAAAPAGTTAVRYAVQPADTLSGIATRFGVPGGWPALYAANKAVIGPDPGLIRPGTLLVLPGRAAPLRYAVAAGDTLSGIAAEFGVHGGWPALYAANRHAIGPDPGLIRPGTTLTITPPPAGTAAAPQPPAPPRQHPAPPAHPAPRPVHPAATPRHHPSSSPSPARTPAAVGMPGWLRVILLAAGLLIAAAFATELALAITRRQRQAAATADATRDASAGIGATETGIGNAESLPASPAPQPSKAGTRPMNQAQTRILMADYDRLIVTHNKTHDLICVLRPPGEDPKAILRVARLILKENPYEQLATQLGIPASWPMD